jgi:hypothetical protein
MIYLKRRLKEVGPQVRDAIADETNRPRSLLTKIAYANRDDSLVSSIEPVLDLLRAVDRGDRELPKATAEQT